MNKNRQIIENLKAEILPLIPSECRHHIQHSLDVAGCAVQPPTRRNVCALCGCQAECIKLTRSE